MMEAGENRDGDRRDPASPANVNIATALPEDRRQVDRRTDSKGETQALSPMEAQVAQLYMDRRSYSDIGAHLKISEKSVDNALQRAVQKGYVKRFGGVGRIVKSLERRKQKLVEEWQQLQDDVAHWNRMHPDEDPIVLSADLTADVEAMKNERGAN